MHNMVASMKYEYECYLNKKENQEYNETEI